jgi:peptidoglycan/LPS O-acetylase OafA/YrhL
MNVQSTPARAGSAVDGRTRLPSLTGLRFIAALLVFCYHVTLGNSPIPPNAAIDPYADPSIAGRLSSLFGTTGFIGVSFFFVLSGFVLAWSSRPGEKPAAFWRRRLVKVFPNHLVTWAVAMALFAGALYPITSWLPNLALVHAYFPVADIMLSVNVPSWTLGCELLFYLLFPLLIRPIRRIPENRLWLWAGILVAGLVAVQLVNLFALPGRPSFSGTPVSLWQFWFGYFLPPTRLFEFVLGAVLARIVAAGRWLPISLTQAGVLMVLGYGLSLVVPYVFRFNVATIIPISALICAGAAADVHGTPTWLRSRLWQWLGEVSFGFYMCQGIVVFYGRWLLGAEHFYNPVLGTLVVLGLFLATLAAGALLYTCVERPLVRRWSRPRRAARPVVTAAATATTAASG